MLITLDRDFNVVKASLRRGPTYLQWLNRDNTLRPNKSNDKYDFNAVKVS